MSMATEAKIKITRRAFESLIRIFLVEKFEFPLEVENEVAVIRAELNAKREKQIKNLEFLAARLRWKKAQPGEANDE